MARLPQLKTLKLPTSVNRVDWLAMSSLERLDIEGCLVTSLDGLPITLKSLNAANTEVTSLQGLPPGLTAVDLRYTSIENLAGLPVGLLSLKVGGPSLASVEPLPAGLERLEMEDSGIGQLGKLPASLVYLGITGGQTTDLEMLPQSLQILAIEQTEISVLPDLPSTLRSIKLVNNPRIGVSSLPSFLTSATHDGSLFALITQLRYLQTLELPSGPTVHPELPASLTALSINFGGMNFGGMAAFVWPQKLRQLALINLQEPVSTIPKSVATLEATDSPEVDFASLPALTNLNLTGWNAIAWNTLPGTLESLDVSRSPAKVGRVPSGLIRFSWRSSGLRSVPQLPSRLEYLDLDDSRELASLGTLPDSIKVLKLSRTGVEDLGTLPRNLEELDISNTLVDSLKALRSLRHITSLTLHAGQVTSLRDLPRTVTRLQFVDPKRRVASSNGQN